MKRLIRVVAPIVLAGAGLTVATVAPAQAEHGACTDQYGDTSAANPYDPTPSVRPTPPAIDTAPTVNYAGYEAGAAVAFAGCLQECVNNAVSSVGMNPHDPLPSIRPTPPAIDTESTFDYVDHDVDAAGQAMRCAGVHDIM